MNKVYSKIESINGSVITVRAKGVKLNELAEITTRFGKSLAEVNKIDGDLVSLHLVKICLIEFLTVLLNQEIMDRLLLIILLKLEDRPSTLQNV